MKISTEKSQAVPGARVTLTKGKRVGASGKVITGDEDGAMIELTDGTIVIANACAYELS